jgi:hypothetical protein
MFDQVLLEKNIFKNILHILAYVKAVSPIVEPPDPRGHDFSKREFVLYQNAFMCKF